MSNARDTDRETVPPLQVPARTIPTPQSISAMAQASLAPGRWDNGVVTFPPSEDVQTWRVMAAEANKGIADAIGPYIDAMGVKVEKIEVGGVAVFDVTPGALRPGSAERIYLDIHGGGLVYGAGDACRAMAALAANRFRLRTWSVDYRMPPDDPYPAALDDCLTVYRALVQDRGPENIVVGGSSAGGNLAAALMLRARDEGMPLPAAVFLFTPEVDLTESGDTFKTNLGVDTVLRQSLAPFSALYAGGHDLTHPYLSPLFGDFTKGFPPTFLQSGTRDLFLSNTVRLHRRLREAGVPAELHVFEAMPHGGFSGAPEDADLDAEVQRYLEVLWP